MEDQIEEIQRLRGCINDLVSLLALPAMWSGREPPEVVGILLDVLLSVLGLDFAYGRLNVVAGESPVEAIRVAQPQKMTPRLRDVGRLLEPWLILSRPAASASKVPNPVGEGEASIACLSLGFEQERGVVVAGSQRDDFPTHIETLLLKVAVNQAITELQRAEILAERNRAEEIERLKNQLHAENFYLRQELNTEQYWDKIVGQSKVLRQVLDLVEQVAPTNACVLILGETGTGKELIARGIHRLSDRKDQAFIKLSCAAIPTSLLESELFGHEKGAFTGAIAKRIGRFELADGGTIFLDEVGEIPLELQPKLLRVLQEQEFERLGSMQTVHVDVRLIAATNRHLKQLVADGEFRSDLYYRLNVFPILVPPLRERSEDIPQLVQHFTLKHADRMKKPITSIAPETMAALCHYSWPGNVRELENFIERSVILSQGSTLDVPLGELEPFTRREADVSTLKDLEREHILRALNESNWVVGGQLGAAAKLGMKRTSLQYKMQKLGIIRPH
jgi:transcriptional regulator with GAF, ATPase, and Fis domain